MLKTTHRLNLYPICLLKPALVDLFLIKSISIEGCFFSPAVRTHNYAHLPDVDSIRTLVWSLVVAGEVGAGV